MPRQGLDVEDAHDSPGDDEQREVEDEDRDGGPVIAHERRRLCRSRSRALPDGGPRWPSPGEPGARRGRAVSGDPRERLRSQATRGIGEPGVGGGARRVRTGQRPGGARGGSGWGSTRQRGRVFRIWWCGWRSRRRRWRCSCVVGGGGGGAAAAVVAAGECRGGPEGRCHARRRIICLAC